MNLDIRENYKYGIAAPTSMGVRLAPPASMPIHMSHVFSMQATSAESNVISVSSSLGIKGLVLANFVEDSPISFFIKSELGKRNIDCAGPDIPAGGPWGYRHQINFADSGFGLRGPRVHNDRAGEVGRILDAASFDLEKIFGEDGVAICHLSGLIAAISRETARFCLDVIQVAKKHGTLISFDMNHRASFWAGRESELREVFGEIAGFADILFGNEEDYQLCLGFEGPLHVADDIDCFKEMVLRIKSAYPGARVIANSIRKVISANEHLWGAVTLFGDTWSQARPRPIAVLDRIGGGDGFAGGLLYGILTGMDCERALQFAWAAGAYVATVPEDYAMPMDEAMIFGIYEGNARVKR